MRHTQIKFAMAKLSETCLVLLILRAGLILAGNAYWPNEH